MKPDYISEEMYNRDVEDLILCGHTRKEAEDLLDSAYNSPIPKSNYGESKLSFGEIKQIEKTDARREEFLRQIKGFDKKSRAKRVQSLRAKGKTKREALQIVDKAFQNKIYNVLLSVYDLEMQDAMKDVPQNGQIKMKIDVLPPDKYIIKYWKLVLKGYSKKDAKRMVRCGEDDLT